MTMTASCELCSRPRFAFCCAACVRRGDFVHSTSGSFPDRFSDKKRKLARVLSMRHFVEGKCRELVSSRAAARALIAAVESYGERIALLELAVRQKRELVAERGARLRAVCDANGRLRDELPLYGSALDKNRARREDRRKRAEAERRSSSERKANLLHLRTTRLRNLTDYVFPVTESSKGRDVTERALAEASRPMKSSGDSHSPTLVPVRLLSTTLPYDGDYSAYIHRVTADKGLTDNSSDAYRIGAALAYSAQLLRLMAFYLDIRLPYEVTYGDFCIGELEERKFKSLVNKLQCCAIVIMNEIRVEKNKHLSNEPPLHALLRMCPIEPKRTCRDCEFDSANDDEEDYDSDSWRARIDRDFLSFLTATSDEEESEPPEHIQWETETEPETTSESPNSRTGIMANATASFVSMWRVFYTKQ